MKKTKEYKQALPYEGRFRLFENEVTTVKEAEDFLRMLYTNDCGFHPEDDPGDIMELRSDRYLFNTKEAVLLRKRMDEVWDLVDPCEYIVEHIYKDIEFKEKKL